MKTRIISILLLLAVLASTAPAIPAITRSMVEVAAAVAAVAGGEGGAGVLGPLPAGPVRGAAAMADMLLGAVDGGGAAAMPAGPNGNLPVHGWLGHVAGVTSGVQAFVAAHPVALGGAIVTVTGGVAFYKHGRQGLDMAFGGIKCYQATMDDYEEVLLQIHGEHTDQSLEWWKRAEAVVACGTGTRPYEAQAQQARADRLELERQEKMQRERQEEETVADVVARSLVYCLKMAMMLWAKLVAFLATLYDSMGTACAPMASTLSATGEWVHGYLKTVDDALAGALGNCLVIVIMRLVGVIAFLVGLYKSIATRCAEMASTLSATGKWLTRGAAAARSTARSAMSSSLLGFAMMSSFTSASLSSLPFLLVLRLRYTQNMMSMMPSAAPTRRMAWMFPKMKKRVAPTQNSSARATVSL